MKKVLFILACFLLLFACNPADLGNQEPLTDDTEITFDGGKDEERRSDRDGFTVKD